MSNVFISVNGRGKYFDEDEVIENGAELQKVSDENYWVAVGHVGFSFDSEEHMEDISIEVDGEPIEEFMQRYSY